MKALTRAIAAKLISAFPARCQPHPTGVPYLSKDLDELTRCIQAVATALEQDRLGHGPEVDNLDDTATSVLTSLRWLTRHPRR
ncbi:hypothetical protein [Actinokineospora globicatena]|uniref:hypothetical protein n=1 Tax=Actinokineospora globicatena TaxID=103729 RepID=UPI0020A59945|nr:hypothetical protein [Actinokineospora globicatena]MCP2303197.1 hypothetical protein [Actinokineospora globicatena]GLW79682.1 hypothetical protein Aglo01_41630 [Actinokineospora globicatena]GLW85908.1 hypothetical protein Aglo02_35480 [Actinokineospora globicatena]